MKRVAILLNSPDEIAEISEDDIICADGGFRHATKKPIAIVGDFDSLELQKRENCIVYPKIKNETDGQLAMDYAKSLGYDGVVIYGAVGGDIGQVLGNIGLLAYAKKIGIDSTVKCKNCRITLVDGNVREKVGRNVKVSLFPFFGDVTVGNSKGLYYPLDNLVLEAGTNRGLSNITTEEEFSLDITEGRLLMIIFG